VRLPRRRSPTSATDTSGGVPGVALGKLTDVMHAIEAEWRDTGRSLEFVINEDYTTRIRELAAHARRNPSTTNEPANRMLQVLTRLRGGKFEL
jgi:hypothetical protein